MRWTDFADCLPNQIDVQNCLALSRCVLPTVRNAQIMEETRLFPQLMQAYPDDKRLQASLDRLRQEHLEDDSFADEIACLLHDCGCAGKPSNAESAGYMLRGFFSSIRRHVAFEDDLMPDGPLIEHQTRVNVAKQPGSTTRATRASRRRKSLSACRCHEPSRRAFFLISIAPILRSFVIWRLTVSRVRPRKSAISARFNGNMNSMSVGLSGDGLPI